MKQVSAAIIIKNGKVLITRRGPNEKLAGMWEFPGGKIEDAETIFECTERELKEELGIQCKANNILTTSLYEYSHGNFEIIAISTEIVNGEISLNVHDKAEWIEVNNLLSYDLLPADIPLAEFLIKNNSCFLISNSME